MKKIVLILTVLLLTLLFANSVHAQSSATKKVKIGNPPVTDACWPTNGKLTQGPRGISDHGDLMASGLTGPALDIGSVPPGRTDQPVYSTFEGTVQVFDCEGKGVCDAGYGNLVRIIPDDNPQARIYNAHLLSISVEDGARVTRGQQIGVMGNTGHSYGVHLHYEFRGIDLAPPYIPAPVTPQECDEDGTPCVPATVSTDQCATTSTSQEKQYWFVLHRQTMTEDFYRGVPGDKKNSELVKTFTVRVGKPNERPTPLPQLVDKEYWTITSLQAGYGSTGPYFLELDIPYANEVGGPLPYPVSECNGQQCNWGAPVPFGIHGTGGERWRVDNDGSQDDFWSSGCARHYDEDITYIYNTLLASGETNTRYYVENN